MPELVRAVRHTTKTYPAWDLAHLGFGNSEVTFREAAALITYVEHRRFRMSCGCTIQEAIEAGATCQSCMAETLAQHPDLAHPDHHHALAWAATPCLKCFTRCQAPFCPQGGCTRHVGPGPDNNHYCLNHNDELTKTLRQHELIQQHGPIKGRARLLLEHLYFGNRKQS